MLDTFDKKKNEWSAMTQSGLSACSTVKESNRQHTNQQRDGLNTYETSLKLAFGEQSKVLNCIFDESSVENGKQEANMHDLNQELHVLKVGRNNMEEEEEEEVSQANQSPLSPLSLKTGNVLREKDAFKSTTTVSYNEENGAENAPPPPPSSKRQSLC